MRTEKNCSTRQADEYLARPTYQIAFAGLIVGCFVSFIFGVVTGAFCRELIRWIFV